MAAVPQARRCSKPGCDSSKTGICIEGNSPTESCPFFGQALDNGLVDSPTEDHLDVSESQQSVETPRVPLPTGEALTSAEVDKFLRAEPIKLVTIVGEFDSGKTTFICALYDRFLHGEFAGYLFGGSRTLVGFEKKSHHSRVDSGRVVPDTLRTSISDGLRFFHLSLAPSTAPNKRFELMLSDRAGEQYGKARGNSDVVPELVEVLKAQHVVLLLDGGRIADPFQRAGAMQSVRQTLRAFLDGGALSTESRVQVVTTKIDLYARAQDILELKPQLVSFRDGLRRDFGRRLGELSYWEVSARDPTGELPPAHGIDVLLQSWCAFTQKAVTRNPIKVLLNTEFDRLLARTSMKEVP